MTDSASMRSTSAHIFVPRATLDSEGPIAIDDATQHHLVRVLRLRTGERVSVSDGDGRWRLATVESAGSFSLSPSSDVLSVDRRPSFQLAVAIPKGDRFDWLVQKVTELGVARIVLLHAERSVVRWKPERLSNQLERARRIADEACRQSRRVHRVTIDGPFDAAAVLAGYAVAEPGGRAVNAGDRMVAIGPEGGWSGKELGIAADRVGLSPNILRTETAAVAATALCVIFER